MSKNKLSEKWSELLWFRITEGTATSQIELFKFRNFFEDFDF